MSGQQDVFYLDVNGLRRRYVLYRPDNVVISGTLAPMVVMLDGRGGTPWTAMRSTLWNAKADREGFVVAYPEATRIDPEGPLHFLTNPQMWNAGPGGSDTERPDVDDLTFLRMVMDDAAKQVRIDTRRCLMAGFSNGAAMTYRYAIAYPETLNAIATVSGHFRLHDADLAAPVPLISFFGKRDPLSPYDGGPVDLPWGKHEERPPAVASVHAWAQLCGHHPDDGRWDLSEPGISRLHYGFRGARDEIEFIAIHELGHVWPGGHRLLPEALVGASSDRVMAVDHIWNFLLRHEARE